jgi:glycosyltransferase involved in cell wall biosynthesis
MLSDDFTFQHVGDGANKDDKFERDIQLLTDGLKEEPQNYRYYFYLAQSHKDLAGTLKFNHQSKLSELNKFFENKEKENFEKENKEKENKEKENKEKENKEKQNKEKENKEKQNKEKENKENKENKEKEINDLETQYKYHFNEAIKSYQIRSQHHDFPEEVYYSLYMLGHCHYHLGSDPHIYTGYFLEAYAYRPQRLEALFQLIKYYRLKQKYNIAYDLGHRSALQPYPKTDCLFIDTRIHNYLFKHEVAIAAYYLGKYDECLSIINLILTQTDIPDAHRKTILEHKRMTDLKIQESHQTLTQNQTTSIKSPTSPTSSLISPKSPTERIKHNPPLITLFSYNFLHTGGSEISDWGLLQHLAKEAGYQIKHSRDFREIYQDRPDLILAQQFAIEKATSIGAELGIPVIVTQHGPSQWGNADLTNNYFIFNTQHLLNSELPRAHFQHYDIIHPCIDTTKYHYPLTTTTSTTTTANSTTSTTITTDPSSQQFITFLGRPTDEKGVDVFIKLAHEMSKDDQYKDTKFLCVGGNLADIIKLKTEYQENNTNNTINTNNIINIEFREFTTQPENIYQVTKVLVLPSKNESFGMVTIEASLCGIPILATALPGIKEATNNLSNYVNSFDDITQWKSALINILNDLASPESSQTPLISSQVKRALQIGEEYKKRYSQQIRGFKNNIERLLKGKTPCPYTRGLMFSVTITVYNRPELVIQAMESVRMQTYQNWELIIIDDASTDQKTWNTLLKYDEEWGDDYKIKLVKNQINQGTFYCRNVGIQEAEGDYIVNLDSDDLLIPSALERLKDTIWENNINIIQFKYYRDCDQDQQINYKYVSTINLDLLAEDPKYRDHKDTSWGLFCLNRKYIINHVGYYDSIRYGADTEYMCRLKNFHQVYNLNQVIYYAMDTKGSLSHQIDQKWSQQYLTNFFKWYNDSKQKKERIYIPFNQDPQHPQERAFPLPVLFSV